MGGCRCTFRSCNVTTQKFPGMHFFHYPLKDKERLEKWIIHADFESIHQLSKAQARNKVVCAFHFRDECFMNYKKDRLTPTAIPSLVRLKNGLVLDYAQSETPVPIALEPPSGKHLIPPKGYAPFGITEDFYSDETTEMEVLEEEEEMSEPLAKRTKIPEIVSVPKKILNKIRLVSETSLNDDDDENTISLVNEVFDEEQYGIVLAESAKGHESKQPLPTISAAEANELIKLAKIELRVTEKDDMDDQEDAKNQVDVLDQEDVVIHDDVVIQEGVFVREHVEYENMVSKAVYNEALEEFEMTMIDLKQEYEKKDRDARAKIARLEEELEVTRLRAQTEAAKVESAESSVKDLQQKLEKAKAANKDFVSPSIQTKFTVSGLTRMTKPQLFNGMKKYLSASMTALVRMEMFGGTERQWKPDEKQVSVEMLRLGEGVYKYFRDEWRFRLPPIKMVEKWANEEAEEDEDDM